MLKSKSELTGLEKKCADALARAERAESRAAKAEAALGSPGHGSPGQGDLLQVAAEEVRHSERLMRAVFTRSTDAILLVDDDGNYVDANPAAAAMFGVKKHVLLRKGVGAYNTDPTKAREIFRRIRETADGRGQVQILRGDEVRTVEFTATTHIRAGLHLVVMRDVTDEHRAAEALERSQAELRRSEARFRVLVENSAEAFALFARDGTLQFITKHAKTMLGRAPEDLVGRRVLDFVEPEDHAVVASAIANIDEEGSVAPVEFRVRHRDGSIRWLEAVGTSLFDDPNVEAFVANLRDVTARHGLEVQLRQAQKMEAIGRLAGGIAHDFNNLLTVILSYTELVLDELGPDGPTAADLREVQMAADRAVDLTKQLLAFSRQQVLEPRVLSIDETLRGVEKMLRRILGEAVELTLELGDSSPIEADPGQIEQVILNLALNARDAMPEGGRLTLATSNVDVQAALGGDEMPVPTGRYVLLSVRDTGTGMDAATRARIFEPFFTTKPPSKGTGLGLATVFGIVQQSRGAIRVDSAPGRGSTFSVYLPRASTARPQAPAPSPAPSSQAQTGGSETLLVVEDDTSVRALVTSVLRRAGYDVLEASNGEEALQVAESHRGEPIALLLTDVVMPKMNGRALVERLSPRFPEVRAVFMSGYTNDDAVLQSVFESRAAFLQKPVTPATLLQKVREVLRNRRR